MCGLPIFSKQSLRTKLRIIWASDFRNWWEVQISILINIARTFRHEKLKQLNSPDRATTYWLFYKKRICEDTAFSYVIFLILWTSPISNMFSHFSYIASIKSYSPSKWVYFTCFCPFLPIFSLLWKAVTLDRRKYIDSVFYRISKKW